ncbi:hypothetical protein [Salipaludibacillus sp. CF4.18]|uniref:hypothetical protein n=1 Tax=Salipaludibacillus sp. CF4.18 TaxID=3373081 RepID=UPI003EE4CC0C
MKIEFRNADGGDVFHRIEKEDVESFLSFLKQIDEINLYIADDYFLHGKISSTMYEVVFPVDEEPEEVLQVFIQK